MNIHDRNHYTTTTSLFYYIWGEACEVTHDYFVINGQLNNHQAPKQRTDRGYIYSKEVCG